MLANNLRIDDKLENGDNLSLLSIASVLRRGSVLDEDMNQSISDNSLSDSRINNPNNGELVTIDIDETINQLSDLSLKKKSDALSMIGLKCAKNYHYLEAIRYFSRAISLCDEDYRLYCNRSYCYERLMNFEDALADALRSVILMPTRPKPFFRQGKALIGLKRYSDAEKAFNKVLEIDSNCADTKNEMLKTRYLALRDFGLNIEEASVAAINHNSIEEAIEASADKKIVNNTNGCDSRIKTSSDYLNDTNTSDNRHDSNSRHKHSLTAKPFAPNDGFTRFGSYKRSQSRPPARMTQSYLNWNAQTSGTESGINGNSASKGPHLMYKRSHSVDNSLRYRKSDQTIGNRFREYHLPKNLFGYKGLWIGNVSPDCSATQMRSIFSKFGSLDYINVVGASYCAFVNYHNPNSPRIAIANLYGLTIPGVSNGERPLVFRFIPGNDQKDLHYMRPYQPKGTNECYFWRTTGCKDFNCPLIHYPVCKGIDFQPWMHRKYKKFH